MSNTLYFILCGLLSVSVLFGISLMVKVKTAVAGNFINATSLFLGIVITMIHNNIFSVWSTFLFMMAGIIIGSTLSLRVKMIQMPQYVALFNGIGGLASALVGVLSFLGIGTTESNYPNFIKVTSFLAVSIGLITLTGSLVAAGKLHKLFSQKPVKWKFHSEILNICLLILMAVTFGISFADVIPYGIIILLIVSVFVSSLFGGAFAIRVGGADMPITISLLNSLSGVAGAIAGMAVNDLMLVSVGGIVGASGLFLTQIMCKSMNRSLREILIGNTSVVGKKPTDKMNHATDVLETNAETNVSVVELRRNELTNNCDSSAKHSIKETIITSRVAVKSDPGEILNSAKSVIIVPGYGMALAQAQHLVRELSDEMEANGAEVKFAIHPVAGRMPGHMNVLLAEVDVPYEKLYEMDSVNDQFASTDLVIVVGANDVINPAADTPIYGMPVLNVDHAKVIFICNYDLNPGYAGVDNPLYTRSNGVHLFLGDANDSLNEIIGKLHQL